MNAWVLPAGGLAALLAMGVPALHLARRAAGDRHHLDVRLQRLRAAGQVAADTAGHAVRPGLGASAPRAVQVALARADVTLHWRAVLPAVVACTLLGVLVGLLAGPLAGILALAAMAALAVLGFRRLANRRLAAFVDGLPVFLDATRQLLLVGNSFQQALVKAGADASPPVQRYLQLLLRRLLNGAPVGDGLAWLAERLDVAELHMFTAAVQTNIRHGGRLTTVIANLTQILRDRARVERELRASTAETRVSGAMLALLPVAVAGLITVFNPEYVRFFLNTPTGHELFLVAAGLELAGVMIMRRIMRLDF